MIALCSTGISQGTTTRLVLTYRKILPIIDRKAEGTKSSSAIFHVHRQQRKAGISLTVDQKDEQLKKTGPTKATSTLIICTTLSLEMA